MTKDMSYEGINSRKAEIMQKSLGIDYSKFEFKDGIGFDYDAMMGEVAYSYEEMVKIQQQTGVGNTPLLELRNITALARKGAPKGKGARIFVKDEAANASGSFKARRASISAYHAAKMGYKGIVTATSGNYGAAVASQAAMRGLKCIVVQECYDGRMVGQPEILEKMRICEAYGAEVVQLSVGPELFSTFLAILEETGYFNASLYTPFGIAGIETLGHEIAQQCRERIGKDPEVVLVTNAGGGNLTGTARGLRKAGAKNTLVYGASVDLAGLHMASDKDFNRKSFTTGHTGFSMPFIKWPDRTDVPRNAARCLRYMDKNLIVKQGEVFYITQALAVLEGYERGPAGNTSLAAAFALAKEMDQDQVIVVNETEYTAAGKMPSSQLTFAKQNGVELSFGDPDTDKPGKTIVFPKHPDLFKVRWADMDDAKRGYVKNCLANHKDHQFNDKDYAFMAAEIQSTPDFVKKVLAELK